jgi:cytochrome P450
VPLLYKTIGLDYRARVTVFHSKSERIVHTHKELRTALRDTEKYSSDLQGDADVRDYRQIPLEVDPPRHHLYRALLAPHFVKPAIEAHASAFADNSHRLLVHYFEHENLDVISDLVLPLVMANLGVVYRRPQDVDEWVSWGSDVWTAESEVRDGAVLHRYLDRIYQEALQGNSKDVWQEIAALEIEGKKLSEDEFRGIAGVLLAGGRDTVIKLLTGALWHLAKHPEDADRLRENPDFIPRAVQEFLRFLSPLPAMNRTTVPESSTADLPADRYISMSFISGNFDETVFANPYEIDINRERNPHLSFGFGPHTCIGNHVTEVEARIFLETFLAMNIKLEIVEAKIVFHQGPLKNVPDRFESLKLLRGAPRQD